MSRHRLPLVLIGLSSLFLILVRLSAADSAVGYLQYTSDRYQHTVDVYTDADAAGNHFAARGEFDNTHQIIKVPTMDEISTGGPCLGATCITATFDPTARLLTSSLLWGGWYFMNGTLTGNQKQPVPDWGTRPGIGYDLTGASALVFWARGASGGEVVRFFAFGVGWDPDTGSPVAGDPESSPRVSNGPVVLSAGWVQYRIDLAGLDLHYVLGGFGWVAEAGVGGNSGPITFYIDNVQFVKERPGSPRFLLSYETIKSANPFDTVQRNTAYVYDNAVALIALVAAGDIDRARAIADALLYAQANDRFFIDGRLRNAYQAGDIALPPGWLPNDKPGTVRMPGWYDPGRTSWFEDESQVSSNTGNIGWAILALLDFYRATQEAKYLQGAERLGQWAINNTWDDRGGGGFTGGYDGWENGAAAGSGAGCPSNIIVSGQCKRLYKSTEHNIDLYSAFAGLYLADGSKQWAHAAGHAKTFFLSMFDDTEGKFWTGTTEDGVTVFKDVVPVDIQAWALLALGSEARKYQRSLAYAETHHKTSLGYGFKQDGGNKCGDNTWFEGTSQVATAYLFAGDLAKWQSILSGVESVQMASGAVPATDGACLNTGFLLNDQQPWVYFPRAHVGATGWLSLAKAGVNPYGAAAYAPALNRISLGADGTEWGLTSAGAVYTYNTEGGFWQHVPGQLARIVVGSGGAVWGINAAGGIYKWNGQGWDAKPGALSQIAEGSDGDVWGLNSGDLIYHFNFSTQNWDQVPGTLTQITVGYDGAVWGLNSADEVYRYNVGTHLFEQMPGSLSQIAAGADGDTWGLDGAKQIWHFNPQTQAWDHIPGSLVQIAVGSGANVWGINAAGQAYHFNNRNQSWTPISGTLSQLWAGENGTAWGVDSSNNVYQLSPATQPTQSWHQIPGELVQVAVAPDGNVWGINSANRIYTFNPLGQNWTWVPGELTQIAVGANGSVWGVNSASQIFTFSPETKSWKWIPGSLSQIAVDGNSNVWGINSANQIYRFNAVTQGWTWIPGSLRQISVGVDGAVWGTSSTDQIYKFNSATQSWNGIPGSLTQVAVGSSSNVCGVNSTGAVFCFDIKTQSWDYLWGVLLAQVAVGFDGTVWGIDSSSQIWRFNSQTQSWAHIPGALTQVSVGAGPIVWGVNSTGSIYRYW